MIKRFHPNQKNSSEDLLRSILDSAFNGILSFRSIRDEQNQIVDLQWIFINDVAEEIVGRHSDELLGESLKETVPFFVESGMNVRLMEVADHGTSLSFEQVYPEAQHLRWFQISVVQLGDGCTVTMQDITQFKEATMEVQSRENKYQRLFEESIDGIFFVDHDFYFLDANEALIKGFGYTLEELKQMSFSLLFESSEEFENWRGQLQSVGRNEEFEVTLIDRVQGMKYCLVNCVSIYDADSKQDNYIGVIRDMTKRKKAELQLLRAEKLSMTGKLARTIAHEVRNPLTNLSLALEQLKDEIDEQVEDADLYFTIISRNTERIGKLISDLLNSSKPKELQLEKQALNPLVREALDLVRDRLHLQSMSLVEGYADDLPDLSLDTDQLKIALTNLFINAIEAMKEEQGQLKVATYWFEDKICLEIGDNGQGISKVDQHQLFEPFFTGKKEGTGLGLTTVQNIVHSHQGSITMDSELGEGTTFYIYFDPEL
ncbi:ATP-binding protein [Reichenbachiella ulvae]|uniref:histidine kinase n=1 Tax=Reichenbachiella ulvae TaxID=2980104 RepID=A0ABT3CNY6_9BACT|nr:ATP-binding protein [Reichenbachiella ulvae]MCV9385445.1 PAS domain S-box protein [Reichenbachiella ulvae]